MAKDTRKNRRATPYGEKLREIDKEYQRKKRASFPELKKKQGQEYKDKFPERVAAHSKVQWALKSGKLKKGKCRDCEREDTQAHHPDYSKPLEVIWLCPRHHKLEDIKGRDNIISQ